MNTRKKAFVSAILLAAGESKRMGKPKLLLPFGGGTVLGSTLDRLLASSADEIIVVLGAHSDKTRQIISGKPVKSAVNPNYKQGMSTSLITGLKLADSRAQRIMVALSDQPLIDTETYDLLIKQSLETDKGITIPVHNGKRGNPIVLSSAYREELMQQKGDIGGRELLQLHPEDVLEVPVDCEGIYINLNTTKEYDAAIGGRKMEADGC